MNEIIELRAQKITINPELDKYNDVVSFPKKLARANAMLEKWGLPKELEDRILQRELKDALWVKGILRQVDADTNTFLIVVTATDNQPQAAYMVTTLSDILNKLVKEYWGNEVRVYIKPQNQSGQQYELIEVA